jgi:hypothetical protein
MFSLSNTELSNDEPKALINSLLRRSEPGLCDQGLEEAIRTVLAGREDQVGELVLITRHSGDDFEEAFKILEQGSIDAVVGYLAQWDFGEDTEAASAYAGTITLSQLKHQRHYCHIAVHAGALYWFQYDPGLRFCALYRLPCED